ncbi:MAG: SpoIIE family protein phosphatase, partial [Bacteroidaceae bacterium]|nr:SpoIIE family protein phosphatase [Bacteroidaceae bacterium]
VDDEQDLEILLTQYFRRKIRNKEYEFVFAHNGIEALELILSQKDFDIVLSDINMPEMDGLTLLTRVNELRNPALKCIMVSAYGDMQNIRTAMNNGAFDFATKPIDMDDLSVTIEKAIEQINYVKQSQREHNQLESIKSELAAAQEIQQAILPRKFPPFPDLEGKLDIYAFMHPAKDVGGDFYDFFRVDAERIGFVMADVSGKGLPAALFMAVSRTLVHSIGMTGCSTCECLERTNRMLSTENDKMMFVTLFYGILNVNTGDICYTNAGHNPPYLLHKDGSLETLPKSPNLVVGVMDDKRFQSETMRLERGDSLILFTDGVTEATNNSDQLFGTERLEKALKKAGRGNSHQTIDYIIHDLEAFVDHAPQSDDITLLSISLVE